MADSLTKQIWAQKLIMTRLSLRLDTITCATTMQWIIASISLIALYALLRCLYLLYFHPLAKYPGPKIAKISNVWYAYQWLTGKYPWAIEKAIKQYGDVVRIAPNEIVFFTPEAAKDIHTAAVHSQELFVKTNFQDVGAKDGGISWERDPAKHREVAKKLHPVFSARALRAQEPTLQGYVDLFICRVKEHGGGENGIEVKLFMEWLASDIAADMAYNRELFQVRAMKTSAFLEIVRQCSFFATIMQIMKKFPLLTPLQFLFLPPSIYLSIPTMLKLNREAIKARIENRGKTKHPDYIQQLCPDTGPISASLEHLEQVAGQLLAAGYDPTSNVLYSTIYFLLKEPSTLQLLAREIRDTFKSYDKIYPDALVSLKYLNAVLHEALRLHAPAGSGMPRKSPGAVVDGHYIPKGVVCQVAAFAAMHSSRYFAEPRKYRPERWLPSNHPNYDPRFADDKLKYVMPFSQGPRACPGSSVGWIQTRLIIAKLIWSFDMEMAPGQDVDIERDVKLFVTWDKPEMWVRFKPVVREK